MDALLNPLFLTSITLAFIHTILGPDHYLPFVALGKSNRWSELKTLSVAAICGLAHCLSSVLIGVLGLGMGAALERLELIESVRGDLASYLLIAFGSIYFIWSLYHHRQQRRTEFSRQHGHSIKESNFIWAIFIIFLFGPCEPLIPILIYPALKANMFDVFLVVTGFTLTTIITMLAMVFFSLRGIKFFSKKVDFPASYVHIFSSLTIASCGVLIVLGL